MIPVLILAAVFALCVVLCKLFAALTMILFAVVKNQTFHRDSAQWDRWFGTMTGRRMDAWLGGVYLAASAAASVLTYFILKSQGFSAALGLTVLFFLVRLAVSAVRYRKKREVILVKFRQQVSN